MSEAREYPESLGEQDTDLRDDPAYTEFAAREEAETDHLMGVRFSAGLAKMHERGAERGELEAYISGYNGAALAAMIRAAGLPACGAFRPEPGVE